MTRSTETANSVDVLVVDASTTEKWSTDWHRSAPLQREYLTAAAYVATMKREARMAGAIILPSTVQK